MRIDTTIDFHADAGGKDPDTHSATLRRYHRLLWSKPLPSGKPFELHESGLYLRHESELGSFCLSGDSIVPTFRKWGSLRDTINRIPQHDIDDFWRVASTIGARIVFPANQINGKHTINQARGINSRIADRFDLTLECIRRHYLRLWSPLADALDRYVDFFELFGGFGGYVEFFLLEDLVAPDGSVRFFKPFDDFQSQVRHPRRVSTSTRNTVATR